MFAVLELFIQQCIVLLFTGTCGISDGGLFGTLRVSVPSPPSLSPYRTSYSYTVIMGSLSQGKKQHAIVRLAPVVQTVDNAIRRINHYPLDNSIGFANVYPLDSDLSAG